MLGTYTCIAGETSSSLGEFAGGSDFAWVFIGIIVVVVFAYIVYLFVTDTWGE